MLILQFFWCLHNTSLFLNKRYTLSFLHSPTVNHHLLRSIATLSGGTYQYYSKDTKSQWQGRLLSQLEKACQPGLTDIHVDWLQTNEDVTIPTQAPSHIPCLFNGCRQVVYGFVESCSQVRITVDVTSIVISDSEI